MSSVRRALERCYFISVDDLTPRVFWRLTDNWLELTVRFIVRRCEYETRLPRSRDDTSWTA